MSRSCWSSGTRLVVLLLALGILPAHGQTIQGRVSDASTSGPVANAVLRLLDEGGEGRVSAAADSDGRYRLVPPAPGQYRLRAERIGYEAGESEPFEVDSATEVISVDLRLNPAPVPVRGVEVTADAVDRRISQFLGMSVGQLRVRPVYSSTIREHAMRGDDLTNLLLRRNVAGMEVLRSRDGPCVQHRSRGCLPIFLNGARLARPVSPVPPLEMLGTIVILLPNEAVAYPGGAVHLFTPVFLR